MFSWKEQYYTVASILGYCIQIEQNSFLRTQHRVELTLKYFTDGHTESDSQSTKKDLRNGASLEEGENSQDLESTKSYRSIPQHSYRVVTPFPSYLSNTLTVQSSTFALLRH